jgi:hypothetical protein
MKQLVSVNLSERDPNCLKEVRNAIFHKDESQSYEPFLVEIYSPIRFVPHVEGLIPTKALCTFFPK